MVSLSDSSRHSGGYFFNDEASSIQAEDEADEPLLTADPDPPFRRINTIPVIVLQILLFIGLVVAAFVLPFTFTEAYALVLLAHGGLWFLILMLDRILYRFHRQSRCQGYLNFYNRSRFLRPFPLFVSSAANALLVIVVTVLEKFCPDKGKCDATFKRQYYIQIIIALEMVVILPALLLYLVRTIQFNRSQAKPDVSQDNMLHSFQSFNHSEIGFRDESYMDGVLEKQADLIQYLKEHNIQLSKQILTLQGELNRCQSSHTV